MLECGNFQPCMQNNQFLLRIVKTLRLFLDNSENKLLFLPIFFRLPIVQAGTFAILSPTLAYLRLPQWKCPTNIGPPGMKYCFGST